MAELAELRKKFEELQAKAELDRAQLERLREQAKPDIVVAPSSKKLEKFVSTPISSTRVNDWISEARLHLRKQSLKTPADEASEITRYLDGPARDDLRWRKDDEKDTPEKIFKILSETFGDKRTTAAAKSRFYERKQKEGETTEEFANALTLLMSELNVKMQTRGYQNLDQNVILRDQFCENVRDPQLRWELTKSVEENPGKSYADVRTIAQRWQTEVTGRTKRRTAEMETVEVDNSKAISKIEKRQEELMELVSAQQKVIQKLLEKSETPTRKKETRRCYNCGKVGHVKRECKSHKKQGN